MAADNFDACIAISLVYEGGYSTIRSDPGNWTGGKVGVGKLKGTKYGIAASSHPTLDIKSLTVADAKAIYRTEYWNKVRGDVLPFGVDLSANDYGINSGPSRSIKDLQRAVGASVDGAIGADTLKRIAVTGGKETVQKHCARRLAFFKGLKTWKTFSGGWSKRVASVEAKGVAMYLAGVGKLQPEHIEELKDEAAKADTKAGNQNKSAGGAAAGGTAVGGGDAITSSEPNWLLIAGIAVAIIAVVTILVVKSRQNKDRAAAYKAVASGG